MQKQQILRIFQVFFGFFITIASLVGLLFLLVIAFMRVMRMEGLRDRIRTFNKRRFNPMALKIAGKRMGGYAVIKHVGRRSGREYTTPVVTRQVGDDGFIVPLPYGRDVDWCRNVMAAGTCEFVWNGQEYALDKPEVITQSQALRAYPLVQRIIVIAGGVKEHLLLHQTVKVPKEVPVGM